MAAKNQKSLIYKDSRQYNQQTPPRNEMGLIVSTTDDDVARLSEK